jgi:radical SAM protein with 4Fe4S-binding SPASM domain
MRCAGTVVRVNASGLYAVEIRLTKACNLRCAHCSVAGGEAARDELGTSEIKHVLDQLAELRVPYVTFTGGEPLLRRDAIKLIAYASSRGLRPNLDTNGMLINPAKAKRLKEVGIDLVQVSIDGTEETHEKIRGQGSYAAAIRGAREVVRAGIPLHINFTLSKLNLSDLEAVVETASSLGARSLSLERFIAIGRGGAIAEQALSSEEFREALHRFFSLAEHTQVKLLTTDPLRVLIDRKLIERYREEMSRRVCGGCTAGIAALTISYDGEVYPCPKLPLSVGNVREQSIAEIWQGNETLAALRAREFKGRCGECELVNLCGGCRGEAFARGDFLGEDTMCWK